MDPLSITTGILTLLGAGCKIRNGLKRILDLRYASDALLALNNEVNELHRIVQDIDDLFRQASHRKENQSSSNLADTLAQTRIIALEVEKLIAYELTVVSIDGHGTRVDPSKLLRADHKIQELKMKMRSNKASLSIHLGILNS